MQSIECFRSIWYSSVVMYLIVRRKTRLTGPWAFSPVGRMLSVILGRMTTWCRVQTTILKTPFGLKDSVFRGGGFLETTTCSFKAT